MANDKAGKHLSMFRRNILTSSSGRMSSEFTSYTENGGSTILRSVSRCITECTILQLGGSIDAYFRENHKSSFTSFMWLVEMCPLCLQRKTKTKRLACVDAREN
jgi:hypothetical protein